jgi:hypothetical protein
MRNFFRKLASQFDRLQSNSLYADRDRYLAQSVDAMDLERRIRDLERDQARHYGYY